MVAIVLHDRYGGDETLINTDRIMYSMRCPDDPSATRIYMDDEKFAADVKETPSEICDLINAAKRKIFSPDSHAVKEEARARYADYLRKQSQPKPP